jgi:hypothetical protein
MPDISTVIFAIRSCASTSCFIMMFASRPKFSFVSFLKSFRLHGILLARRTVGIGGLSWPPQHFQPYGSPPMRCFRAFRYFVQAPLFRHSRASSSIRNYHDRRNLYQHSIHTTIRAHMKDKVTIKIPRELYETLQNMIEGTGFSSTTEFIVFVMRTLASTGTITEEDRLTENEVQIIKARLKRLGYL